MAEAKGQIVVAAGLEQGERRFEVIPRLAILAGDQLVIPAARWATQASRESGRASMSLRRAAACARIDGNSPRSKLPAQKPKSAANRSGASLSPKADSRALAKASVVSGAPYPRAAMRALP
jgi:hypothetical protein